MVSFGKILVAPLDWGLGHASRIIPIIKLLLFNKAEVILGGDGDGMKLLKNEFPDLQQIKIPFPEIKYTVKQNLIIRLLFSSPKILIGIIREHYYLKKIIKKENINVVISDNRYGLWNKHIKSVFITHQLMLQLPGWLKWAEWPVHFFIIRIIKRFDICWIPDFADKPGLSGFLSHKYNLPDNAVFVGPLSRFNTTKKITQQIKRKILIILSGPEPQRSVLEKILTEQLINSKLNALIVRGLLDTKEKISEHGNLTYVSFLSSKDLIREIYSSEIIICRAGYSSIMDLYTIKKKAILIPTPGQTEQEYLAEHLKQNKMFYSRNQREFVLEEAINQLKDYELTEISYPVNNLDNEIQKLFPAQISN